MSADLVIASCSKESKPTGRKFVLGSVSMTLALVLYGFAPFRHRNG